MASEAGKGDKQRPMNRDLFESNFDRIFGDRKKQVERAIANVKRDQGITVSKAHEERLMQFANGEKTEDQIMKELENDFKTNVSRMDTIGQNGNDGLHYDSDDNVDRWSAVLRDEYDSKYWKDQ